MTVSSVAILPFVDLSAERDQQYFCDGLAAELIAALSRVEGLRVAPRSSSIRLRSAEDAQEAGRQLGVATAVEGSVAKSDERLRVSARLVRVEDGAELWSRTFDRPLEDLFAVQHEIAEPTSNLRAYEYYLEGRERFFEYRRRGVEAALTLFNRALELDSDYARALAGVADSCCYLVMYADGDDHLLERAEQASRRSLEIAPDLAEAQVARGLVLSLQQRYEASEEAFEKAIDLDPKLFEAYYFYARNSFAQGELETAAKLFKHASIIDPDDYQAPLLLGQIYDTLERPVEAAAVRRQGVRAAERRLRHNPEETRALYMAANALVCLGQSEQGLRWAERALALEPDEPMLLYNVGCIYSLAGKLERAVDCVEKAVAGGDAYVDWLRQDSNLDSLRDHPRFQALLARHGSA
jgi:TolB-like protein/Flp pilus assembly protein TadD